MTTYNTIEIEKRGRVGILRFNRPKALNSMNDELMREGTEALQQFNEDDDVLAIVVTGSGTSFCAGFDLKELAVKNYTDVKGWGPAIEADLEFIMQFWYSKKPTISAVHGYCLAGGLELAVACDITVADSEARFGEPEVKFGSSIVSLILPWLIGPKFAKEMILTGNDRITAQRAAEIGLVNRVVTDGNYLEAAVQIAEEICAASAFSVQMTKRAINRTMDAQGMREAIQAASETAMIVESNMSPEMTEFSRIRATDGLKAAITWRDSLRKK
ncbi:enoyl-CoA hydratase/isomerase family protein [Paraburkholderia nemoris]|uniref:enoyl-CoA hydratase/isomerase family protein n=1 Tax=Paraburkholderia nemoris TaxID=2793076 RepID=UPI001B26ADC9|nr:enoyl-CoA hydratase/isomerase family protein [Paraburkholderia nemoris]CAE6711339.1 putative enoyl-CoA hydratase echA8 [Paraburkholderia nemoris]